VTADTFAGDILGYSAVNSPAIGLSRSGYTEANEDTFMKHISLNDSSTTTGNSSMQLTRAADYAVRVMVHLATLPPECRVLLPALAEATAAPESFLSKVLQALARAELICSRRGKRGGFAILPRGREATMREVIESVDGPICLNLCLNGGKECERKSWCPAHPVWARAQRAMVDVLMSVTVSSMAAKSGPVPSSEFPTTH
jgi:Rrf2 family iron-sulfur cluster assembly transcriptional regulator